MLVLASHDSVSGLKAVIGIFSKCSLISVCAVVSARNSSNVPCVTESRKLRMNLESGGSKNRMRRSRRTIRTTRSILMKRSAWLFWELSAWRLACTAAHSGVSITEHKGFVHKVTDCSPSEPASRHSCDKNKNSWTKKNLQRVYLWWDHRPLAHWCQW